MTAPGTSPLAELAELAALARLEECDEDVERLLRRLVRRADPEHGTSDLPWTPVRH